MPAGKSGIPTRRKFLAIASATALVAVLPALALAADDDAGAFVRSLYALPNLWGDVTADDAAIAKYLDAKLGALITENYAKDDPESALDYDPLIQAQDFDEISATFIVDKETDTSAVVTAVVENFDERTHVTLDLTRTADGWRLADVLAPDGSSLLTELKKLNASG